MWQFDGTVATLEIASVRASISPAQPGNRQVELQTAEDQPLGSLWSIGVLDQLELVETFVRKNDLVARYAPSEGFPFYTEFYWTVRTLSAKSAPLIALSLLVSVRTDLLDTHPEVLVTSTVNSSKLVEHQLDDGQMFCGSLSSDLQLIEFATTEDCAKVQLEDASHSLSLVRRELFSHFLEKGVIRRANLFAAVANGDCDTAQATEWCQEFADAELPLTT